MKLIILFLIIFSISAQYTIVQDDTFNHQYSKDGYLSLRNIFIVNSSTILMSGTIVSRTTFLNTTIEIDQRDVSHGIMIKSVNFKYEWAIANENLHISKIALDDKQKYLIVVGNYKLFNEQTAVLRKINYSTGKLLPNNIYERNMTFNAMKIIGNHIYVTGAIDLWTYKVTGTKLERRTGIIVRCYDLESFKLLDEYFVKELNDTHTNTGCKGGNSLDIDDNGDIYVTGDMYAKTAISCYTIFFKLDKSFKLQYMYFFRPLVISSGRSITVNNNFVIVSGYFLHNLNVQDKIIYAESLFINGFTTIFSKDGRLLNLTRLQNPIEYSEQFVSKGMFINHDIILLAGYINTYFEREEHGLFNIGPYNKPLAQYILPFKLSTIGDMVLYDNKIYAVGTFDGSQSYLMRFVIKMH